VKTTRKSTLAGGKRTNGTGGTPRVKSHKKGAERGDGSDILTQRRKVSTTWIIDGFPKEEIL